jgi:hypothetical protein
MLGGLCLLMNNCRVSGFTFYMTSYLDCMLSLMYVFVNCSSKYVHFVLYNMSFIAGISCSGG